MNCKPGDLAIVNAVENEYQTCLLGQIIRVTHLYASQTRPGVMAWAYEPTLRTPKGGRVIGFFDEELLPIRPGDVTDKEVRDLYAPDRSMKDSPLSDTTSPSEKKEAV